MKLEQRMNTALKEAVGENDVLMLGLKRPLVMFWIKQSGRIGWSGHVYLENSLVLMSSRVNVEMMLKLR